MGLFGGNTNATQNSRLLGYRVSTSISGSVIPLGFGTFRVPGNVIWIGDWKAQSASGKAGKGKYGGNYTYSAAGIIALCFGPIDSVIDVWTNQIHNGQTDNFLSAVFVSGLGLTIFDGALGQAPWAYVTTNHPEQALGYSQLAYAANSNFDLGSSGVMPNYSYEVRGPLAGASPGGQDALCSDVIYALLTDPFIGAGFATSEVDMTETAFYCGANGIVVSPVLDQQKTAASWLDTFLLIANAEAVWSEGVLKIRSRGDTAITKYAATFVPNLTPVYDLTDDDFKDREEPVRVMRPDPRDAYNSVKINWTNRGNQYNTEPLEEKDQYMIDTYGPRPMSPIDALGICRADVATQVAHVQLKRNIYLRTRYKFKLGFEHVLLEPMDIVTLTCSRDGLTFYQGLNRTPVRILSISEDTDGYLDCEAEPVVIGASNSVLHPKQASGGYTPPLTGAPGNVNPPIFSEGSREMKQLLYGTPYALFVALSGGPYWGGCTIHRSFDGSSYDVVGRQVGRTTMGTLTANLASHTDPDTADTLSVNLLESFGALATVTQADADNFKTLSVIGAELLSYETSTLTSKYNYDLTYLRRGVYGSPVAAHNSSDSFFRVDNASVWLYQSQDVHKTVYFKFTSFNQYGLAEQNIADVTAYPYTLTGGLSAVKTITSDYTVQPSDTALNVDTSAGPITITLPDATATVNTTVTITKISADANAVTILDPSTGQTWILTQQYESITYESTNQGWVVISKTTPFDHPADDETPAGVMDGVNPTFTLAHIPNPAASLRLYRNGNLDERDVEYSLVGNTITYLTTDRLPNDADEFGAVSGERLRAWYRY